MKIHRYGSEASDTKLGANSQTITNGDFVTLSGNTVVKSVATGIIDGVSNQTITTTADNVTVAKATVSFTKVDEETEYDCTISGGTITVADEGKFFNLTAGGVVDGATESTVASYIDTTSAAAVDAVVRFQLRMVKFISATKGIFKVNML